MPRNILPRYSPISPRNNRFTPEKKQMAAIMDGQPIAIEGTISFRITVKAAPNIPNREKMYPQ